MPFAFPTSPTLNQQWPTENPRFQWDGVKWRALGGGLPFDVQPVTLRYTSLLGSDDFIALRGVDSVPGLVSTDVMAATFGGEPPAATAPAAMTAGQWTAEPTVTAGEMGINITALPSDGGSAITALEYRVGAGAATALAGTGTGLRVVTAGFTAGVAADIQVRAANAVGAADWSDTKNRTPAAGGGGSATYHTAATTPGNITTSGLTATAPSGVVGTDTLVAFVHNVWNGVTILPPDGWTLRGTPVYATTQGTGIQVYTAPGTVTDFNWQTSSGTSFGVMIAVVRCSGIAASPIADQQTLFDESSGANVPGPAVTATAGGIVLSALHQAQSANAFGTPQTDYTRIVDYQGGTDNGFSLLVREDVAAGSTGTISHATNIAFQARTMVTIALAAA